jgi:hypothetical protein
MKKRCLKILHYLGYSLYMKVEMFRLEDQKKKSVLCIMRIKNIEIKEDCVENQVTVMTSRTRNANTKKEATSVQTFTVSYAEDLYKWNLKNGFKDNREG